MSITGVFGSRLSSQPDRASATMLRVGHVAGVLAIATVLFASLYFFVLYLASE